MINYRERLFYPVSEKEAQKKIDQSDAQEAQANQESRLDELVDPDALSYYFEDLKKYPLLTVRQEVFLSQIIHTAEPKNGTESYLSELEYQELSKMIENRQSYFDIYEPLPRSEAKKIAIKLMIESNLKLVVSFAFRVHLKTNQELEDLIQAGNLGLYRAVEKFEGDRGIKFSTYAVPWIRQAISRSGRHEQGIQLSEHEYIFYVQIKRAEAELTQKSGDSPTDEQIAQRIIEKRYKKKNLPMPVDADLEVEKTHTLNHVSRIRRANQEVSSLDAVDDTQDDDGTALLNVIEDTTSPQPEQVVMDSIISRIVAEKISLLLAPFNDRDRFIFESRFGLNGREQLTLEKIGEQIGVSRERVRQREQKIINKMRISTLWRELKDMLVSE